ncbi:hypothetical protein [Cryptosporidium parvum Iowa II]|uniref:Uncharacterized protein n=2 Tax=Cryptosporidium parvum TaxID=5807 RepID=Q5CQA2_CRYPI|nr:hypothetical protein [Cryptosporidium parvum Iowa II]EAK87605.1 hypothetical protein cgd4_1500 [Cryptosporidium parvum Iowa II]QOY42039.1 Uncharacterized protein CPATCC_0018620 [Cryptosporidium parvum]WKS77342.1 hypothetical protein CPCDC_4g1500 [Cryptosporidium sp. 43IA8]WRK31987.1 Uncharacterized protein cpbgf_4001500 [Cryptosporidium parvum]|eukprot:QOY42039.1 hypothetical protein CPATCC_001636 [Cryptosporidium parvum]
MVEIYASESSEVGKQVNWNYINKDSLSNINELDVTVLKEIYSEIIDFANKLAESNRIMEDYKDDEDIVDAIDENEGIIKRKKEIIELIESRFKQLNREDLINESKLEIDGKDCKNNEDNNMEEYL